MSHASYSSLQKLLCEQYLQLPLCLLATFSQPTESPSSYPTSPPTQKPTNNPSLSPSSRPTENPTPIPYCPPAYDSSKVDYTAGESVEIDSFVFKCSEEPGYEVYCNIAEWDESNTFIVSEGLSKDIWNNAWEAVSACYTTQTPTTSPVVDPTAAPSR